MEQKIWWYSLNNEQKGPVTADELNLLSNQNFITSQTLVWKERFQNWINFSEINVNTTHAPAIPPLPNILHSQLNSGSQTNKDYPQTSDGFSQAAPNSPNINPGYSQTSSGFPPSNPGIPQPPPQYNSRPVFNSQQPTSSANNGLNLITDPYYKTEFEKILNSEESYKGKWNWWAFFFNWVWCFTKGLWQFGLLILLPIIVLPYFVPLMVSNFYAFGVAIFFGSKGTWFYYTLKIKNKQLF